MQSGSLVDIQRNVLQIVDSGHKESGEKTAWVKLSASAEASSAVQAHPGSPGLMGHLFLLG